MERWPYSLADGKVIWVAARIELRRHFLTIVQALDLDHGAGADLRTIYVAERPGRVFSTTDVRPLCEPIEPAALAPAGSTAPGAPRAARVDCTPFPMGHVGKIRPRNPPIA